MGPSEYPRCTEECEVFPDLSKDGPQKYLPKKSKELALHPWKEVLQTISDRIASDLFLRF